MVEVIAPFRMHSEPTIFDRPKNTHVVQVALRDHMNLPPELGGKCGNLRRKLREKRVSARVKDAVHRIQPQGIEVEFTQPVQCVLNEEKAHLITVSAIVIQ